MIDEQKEYEAMTQEEKLSFLKSHLKDDEMIVYDDLENPYIVKKSIVTKAFSNTPLKDNEMIVHDEFGNQYIVKKSNITKPTTKRITKSNGIRNSNYNGNYTFSYNQNEMIMATNSVLSSEDCIDGLKSSLSGLSSSDGEIQSALDSAKSQIGACFSGITSCANALTNIKTIADYCLDEEEFSSTLSSVSNIITQGTLKHTTLNCGQSGFLYVPNGETKGKALVTWLDPSEVGLEKNGLGGLISNGYNPAAVVWIPVRNAGQAFGGWYHRNPDGTFPFLDKTAEAVAELQNKFDLDKNRNVLAGFSNGAYGASMLAATHPNMFSRVIIIGGCAHDDRDIQVPLQNAGKDTSWVFIEIKGEVAESASSLAYQQIRESGGQAIKYQVVNDTGGALLHGHGANFINANIIDDAINYRKGTYINGWSENNNSGYSVTQLNNSQSLGYTANDLKKYYESQYITVRYSTIINGYDHRTENSVENNWYINSNYSGTGVTEQI